MPFVVGSHIYFGTNKLPLVATHTYNRHCQAASLLTKTPLTSAVKLFQAKHNIHTSQDSAKPIIRLLSELEEGQEFPLLMIKEVPFI